MPAAQLWEQLLKELIQISRQTVSVGLEGDGSHRDLWLQEEGNGIRSGAGSK